MFKKRRDSSDSQAFGCLSLARRHLCGELGELTSQSKLTGRNEHGAQQARGPLQCLGALPLHMQF
jgi:hypothetical protein